MCIWERPEGRCYSVLVLEKSESDAQDCTAQRPLLGGRFQGRSEVSHLSLLMSSPSFFTHFNRVYWASTFFALHSLPERYREALWCIWKMLGALCLHYRITDSSLHCLKRDFLCTCSSLPLSFRYPVILIQSGIGDHPGGQSVTCQFFVSNTALSLLLLHVHISS